MAIAVLRNYWYNLAMLEQDAEGNQFAGWQSVRWPIGLETPPVVRACSIGVHGIRGDESFHLSDLWCLHFYNYSGQLDVGDQRFPIRPGFAGVIPPDTQIHYHYHGRCQHLYAHFSVGESDRPAAAPASIPAMQDLGDDFGRYFASLSEVMETGRSSPGYRVRARVWDILIDLASRSNPGTSSVPSIHPAVEHAVRQVEIGLAEPISVARLALEADISYSYLGKLFQRAFGITAVEYIRSRRMVLAEHLLRHTSLPVKTIAASVGISDLHLFNKTIRSTFGVSPRKLRGG